MRRAYDAGEARLLPLNPSLARSLRYSGDDQRRGSLLLKVVIALLATTAVLAVLLPAIQAGREAARRQQVKSNLSRFGWATRNYTSASPKIEPESSGASIGNGS